MDTVKYNEDELLKEVSEYISNTYKGHYSAGNVQTLDLIDACGDAEAFCRSNVLKYASRYDRKGSARKDIIKIIHYGICSFISAISKKKQIVQKQKHHLHSQLIMTSK